MCIRDRNIIEASALTIWPDVTHPDHRCLYLHHPPSFTPDALLATTLPIYPGLGQAPNMLDCLPRGLLLIVTIIKGKVLPYSFQSIIIIISYHKGTFKCEVIHLIENGHVAVLCTSKECYFYLWKLYITFGLVFCILYWISSKCTFLFVSGIVDICYLICDAVHSMSCLICFLHHYCN